MAALLRVIECGFSESVFRGAVDCGFLEQVDERGVVGVLGGDEEKGLVGAGVGEFGVGAFFQEMFDGVGLVVPDGPMERGAAVLVGFLGIDVGAVGDEEVDDLVGADGGGVVERGFAGGAAGGGELGGVVKQAVGEVDVAGLNGGVKTGGLGGALGGVFDGGAAAAFGLEELNHVFFAAVDGVIERGPAEIIEHVHVHALLDEQPGDRGLSAPGGGVMERSHAVVGGVAALEVGAFVDQQFRY